MKAPSNDLLPFEDGEAPSASNNHVFLVQVGRDCESRIADHPYDAFHDVNLLTLDD